MCTESLSQPDIQDRKQRCFRLFLSLFGFLAVAFLAAGCCTDWWVVYSTKNKDRQSVFLTGHTGLWKTCISPNSTVELCESILTDGITLLPELLPWLITLGVGILSVTVAEILLLLHIRFMTRFLPSVAAAMFFLGGFTCLVGCLFLWILFNSYLPWYTKDRASLPALEGSIDWSFLLALVGSIYSVVYGMFLVLAIICAKRGFSDSLL
ncbi:hypothetical protein HOLleu_07256 [Holothuria leucospilota]|uniref:Claudin n=1 Tax=Holothuria leucospilota TaxID=206669 RepID=A0A9Q1CFQ1_HOLLE|nr:hypothetical protein HOLleu_07256 [Holothuria leucospilota]